MALRTFQLNLVIALLRCNFNRHITRYFGLCMSLFLYIHKIIDIFTCTAIQTYPFGHYYIYI